jgi:uncharacterized protein (DUF1684 family)
MNYKRKFEKMIRIFFLTCLIPSLLFLLNSCDKNYTPEEEAYIKEINELRKAKDEDFKSSLYSPFNQDVKAHFAPLKYFDVDPSFKFKSKLYEYISKDTVKVSGTKGEERKAVRYGYLKFIYEEKEFKVNVYKGWSEDGQEYFSIWFTDKTTGEETYGVGRYLDFELSPLKEFTYTIDFNLAYNPYCAYSATYSCAVPTKEDYLDIEIKAGEKNFH